MPNKLSKEDMDDSAEGDSGSDQESDIDSDGNYVGDDQVTLPAYCTCPVFITLRKVINFVKMYKKPKVQSSIKTRLRVPRVSV